MGKFGPKLDLLLGRLRSVDGHDIFHHLSKVCRLSMKCDLSQLEVREIQQVVQEPTQTFSMLVDHLEERAGMLPVLERSIQEGLQISPDRSQGGTELM